MNTQLIEVLKELKWSEYETQVYAILVEKGAMYPPDIVNEIDIPSGRVYDVLKALTKKGAVIQTDVRPVTYDAQNPRMVLQTLVNDLEKKINKALRTAEASWESRVGALDNGKESVWTVQSKRGIESQLRSLFNSTTNSLLFCDEDISWLGKKDLKQIKKLSDNDKEVKIISTRNFKEELENLASMGAKTSIGKDFSSYYIFDFKTVLLKIKQKPSAVIINDKKFVEKTMKEFASDYKAAKEVKVKEVVG